MCFFLFLFLLDLVYQKARMEGATDSDAKERSSEHNLNHWLNSWIGNCKAKYLREKKGFSSKRKNSDVIDNTTEAKKKK